MFSKTRSKAIVIRHPHSKPPEGKPQGIYNNPNLDFNASVGDFKSLLSGKSQYTLGVIANILLVRLLNALPVRSCKTYEKRHKF